MRSRSLAQICFVITIVMLALSGCGSNVSSMNSGTPAGTAGPAPVVAAMGVETNGVAPNRWIYAQFSEAMDPTTINPQTFTVAASGGKPVSGKVAYYASYDVAGFMPSPALQEDAKYTVTLSTGVASAQGTHLASAYTDSITTRAYVDTSPISVKSVSPAPNATCVSATAPITIAFSEGVEVSTVNSSNITITGPNNEAIEAQISYDVATAVVTLRPSAPLPSGNITVKVQNVADAAGVPMPFAYGWDFSTDCGPGATVAYVYVSFSPDYNDRSAPNEIMAYAADAHGQLTPVPGSPFSDDVSPMAVSGKYLMGGGDTDVNTYEIESDGSLSLVAQISPKSYNGPQHDPAAGGCGGGPASLFFDRTGRSLYANVNKIDCADNQGTDTFSVDQSTGSLSYVGRDDTGYNVAFPDSLIGTNTYAYAGFPDCMYGNLTTFRRSSSGLLSSIPNGTPPEPTPPPTPPDSNALYPSHYQSGMSATDSSNHIAFEEVPCFVTGGPAPLQLAAYTADATGKLTTNDTYTTMPTTPITYVYDMKMSPSGKLLAVAGAGGLQVFHFNGANPITPDTGLLTTDTIGRVFWDKNNHLYAITGGYVTSAYSGKLYVFTITDTGAHQAPGSPYTIPNPFGIAVKPTW